MPASPRFLFPGLWGLLALSAPLALADEPAQGVVLKRGDAASCERLETALATGAIRVDDDLRKTFRDAVCKPEPPKKAWKGAIDASGDVSRGNEDYTRLKGALSFEYEFDERNRLHVSASDEYRSDAKYGDKITAVFTTHYYFAFTEHWAVFAQLEGKHDAKRGIEGGTSELAGLIYSVYPVSEYDEHYVALSAGAGHRYELYSDLTDDQSAFFSYRAKGEWRFLRYLRFATAIWFEQRARAAFASFEDYRAYFEAKLTTDSEFSKRYVLSFGLEDEYFSKPFIPVTMPDQEREKNDLKIVVGLGVRF